MLTTKFYPAPSSGYWLSYVPFRDDGRPGNPRLRRIVGWAATGAPVLLSPDGSIGTSPTAMLSQVWECDAPPETRHTRWLYRNSLPVCGHPECDILGYHDHE